MKWIRAIKSLMYLISSAVGLSLLMGLWSIYINPAQWIIPSLFGMIYPYVFLLNAALLVFALLYSRRFALVHVVLMLIGLSQFNRFCVLYNSNQEEVLAPESTKLKVMSFNVRGFNRYEWIQESNIQSKIEQLIIDSAPDIIFFQEFHTAGSNKERALQEFSSRIGLPFYIGQNEEGRKALHGLAIFSRYPLKRIRVENFHKQRYGGNGYVVADVTYKERTIRLVNMHLESLRFEQPEYAYTENPGLEKEKLQSGGLGILRRYVRAARLRGNQSAEIAEIAKRSEYPVICAGDANDYPISYAYHNLSEVYQDSYLFGGTGVGSTYAGKVPFLRIDYVMATEELHVSDFSILNTQRLSDHFPLSVTYSW